MSSERTAKCCISIFCCREK